MKFRSGFEKKFSEKFDLPYEKDRFKYRVEHRYTPDFKVTDKIFVETKGLFSSSERTKTLEVMKQNDVQIVFVFMNPSLTLRKGSKTTYANWCKKNDVLWFTLDDPELARWIEYNREF